MRTTQSNNTKPGKLTSAFWLAILAGVLLVISNSAVWVNNYIFDENNFSQVVSTSLTSESSRQAIAEGVTDKVFQDRPVLKRVAGDVSTNIISGLLNTSQADTAIQEATRRLNVVVTSSSRDPVVIDLSGVKNILTQLVDVSTSLGREPQVDPNTIPSEITVLERNALPNFYKWGVAFLWIAPLAFIGALAALAYPYIKHRQFTRTIIVMQGACIAAVGLFALLVGPLFRPPLLSNLKTSSGRVVVGNLYDAFIATFNAQTRLLIGVGVAMMVVGGLVYAYGFYRTWAAGRNKKPVKK